MSLLSYPFPKCLNPVKFVNKYSQQELFVPCGKCWICKQNKGFKYSKQCQLEACTSKVVLLTLTFANSFIPRATVQRIDDPLRPDTYCMFDESTSEYLGEFSYTREKMAMFLQKCHLFGRIPYLSKYELQLFLKRLRHYLKKYENLSIRYFACGEYGPEHFRPHFHILLFIEPESEKLFSDSCHTLGEFPKFTWSHRKNVIYTTKTPLSKLEYYIRKSWSYGSTDFARITQGDASSYVAQYVNSSVDVPPCFNLQSCKPFCIHSRFLGRKIFAKEFIQVCKSSPKDLISQSVIVSGKYENTRVPNEVIATTYPRCKGFSYSTNEQLFYRYMLYPRLLSTDVFRFSEDINCTSLASDITQSLVDFYNQGYVRTSYNDVIQYFFQSTDFEKRYTDYLSSEQHDQYDKFRYFKFIEKISYSIYRELLISKLFYNNANRWKDYLESCNLVFCEIDFYRLFFKKIINFWKYAEYCNLTKWYDDQNMYFNQYYADSSDITFMYNNTNFDEEEFLKIRSYDVYVADSYAISQDIVKHKLQNDKNKIFNY